MIQERVDTGNAERLFSDCCQGYPEKPDRDRQRKIEDAEQPDEPNEAAEPPGRSVFARREKLVLTWINERDQSVLTVGLKTAGRLP